jgi:CRP-like cAMP-binding protein/Pyruvate/2-oxoacid:ferredoxin oxidoreductase delta subunit
MAKDVILQAELGGAAVTPDELAAIPSLSGIRREIWSKFPGAVAKKMFAPGDVIFRQGESGTTAFLLISGTVEISLAIDRVLHPPPRRPPGGLLRNIGRLADYLKGSPVQTGRTERPAYIPIDGNIDVSVDDPIARLEPGDLFGELSALAALRQDRIRRAKFYPRSATARAATHVEVIEMLPNILNNVLYTSPAFKQKLNESYRTRALDTHLRSVPVFRDVPRDFLESLKQRVELVDYQPGQVIYREGDAADAFYLIRLGFVKVSRTFPGGEMVLSYLSRGSYFGENGIVAGGLMVRAIGPEPGLVREVVVTAGSVISCGRSVQGPDTLSIPWDSAVSRKHFELRMESGGIRVTRLAAGRNPLVHNSRALSSIVLAAGEHFTVGDTRFEISGDSDRGGTRSATVIAMDFVQTVRLRRDDFLAMIQRYPEVAATISEVAQARSENDARTLSRVHTVSLEQFLEQDLMQGQDVLLIDLDRCVRCDECVDACVATHNDGFTRLIREGVRFDNYLVATSCRACLDPLCMTRCPVGSIRRKGTLDIVIENWCIGCGNCAADCPYGAINIVPTAVARDPRPKAAVCDLCSGYAEPNCVRACPHDAALRVEPRSFFARDLAGVQLEPPAQHLAAVPIAAAGETRLHSNIVSLVALLPRVEVAKGSRAGEVLQLKPAQTIFGRMPDLDYPFSDQGVSRLHCTIVNDNGVFTIKDGGSTNGTFVNNVQIDEKELRDGDIIQLGVVEMIFLTGEARADRS